MEYLLLTTAYHLAMVSLNTMICLSTDFFIWERTLLVATYFQHNQKKKTLLPCFAMVFVIWISISVKSKSIFYINSRHFQFTSFKYFSHYGQVLLCVNVMVQMQAWNLEIYLKISLYLPVEILSNSSLSISDQKQQKYLWILKRLRSRLIKNARFILN